MTREELRAEAERQGFRLVHRDRIRTARVQAAWSKFDLHRIGEEAVSKMLREQLGRKLGHFLVGDKMLDIRETPQEWHVEYDADLTVIGPKTPPPDSEEHFLYMPRDWETR